MDTFKMVTKKLLVRFASWISFLFGGETLSMWEHRRRPPAMASHQTRVWFWVRTASKAKVVLIQTLLYCVPLHPHIQLGM